MPLYEYQCFVCEHRFERLQKVSATVVNECPNCGGRVRRLLGVPALQFKGSGWYVTDYGKGNGAAAERQAEPKNGANADEPSTKTESSDSKKTESTPKHETTSSKSAETGT